MRRAFLFTIPSECPNELIHVILDSEVRTTMPELPEVG